MSEFIFTPWRKYGHDRTYIATADDQKLGHRDNKTGELVLLDESWRPAVEAALSGSLTSAPAPSSSPDELAVSLPPDAGLAGGSARAEYQRRVARRDQRNRQAHPRLGGLILALSNDPQSTRAWASGAAVGEARVGAKLDGPRGESLREGERSLPPHGRVSAWLPTKSSDCPTTVHAWS